jgi:hypothetical protein
MGIINRHNFQEDLHLDGRMGEALALTRATAAVFRDWDGKTQPVISGEERYTGCRRVQNEIDLTDDHTAVQWNKLNITIDQDTSEVKDPFGGNKATKITDDAANDEHNLNQFTNQLEADGSNAFSWYVKRGNLDWCYIGSHSSSSVALRSCWFNLANGTVGTQGAATLDPRIKDEGGGWYRISIRGTGSTSSHFTVGMSEADNTPAYAGGSNYMYVYGGQMEDVFSLDDPAPQEYVANPLNGTPTARLYRTKRRTNLCAVSDDFEDAFWNRITGTTIASGVADPDGGYNAYTVTATGAGAFHSANQGDLVPGYYSGNGSTKLTSSVWIRRRTGVGSVEIYTSYGATKRAISVTSSWQRLSYTEDVLTGGTSDLTGIYLATSGDEVDIYKFQIEKGSDVTPHILTEGTIASSDFDTQLPLGPGLHYQQAATNLILRSHEFDETASVWNTPVSGSVDADVSPGADGSLSADRLGDDNGGGSAAVRFGQNVTVATTTQYTLSCWFRKDQLDWAYLRLNGFTTPVTTIMYFDLANGVAGSEPAALDSSGIEDWGSGLFRCWITFTTDAADTAGTIQLGPADADGDDVVARDGTSNVFGYGCQLEVGPAPTAYMATQGATVTRNAETFEATLVAFAAGEGTIYTRHRTDYDDLLTGAVLMIDNNALTDYHQILARNTLGCQYVVTDTTVQASLDSTGAYSGGVDIETASAWAVNDFEHYVDGVRVGTGDQAGSLPTGLTRLRLAHRQGGGNQVTSGHMAEFVIYDERLDNTALGDLSQGIFPSGNNPIYPIGLQSDLSFGP